MVEFQPVAVKGRGSLPLLLFPREDQLAQTPRWVANLRLELAAATARRPAITLAGTSRSTALVQAAKPGRFSPVQAGPLSPSLSPFLRPHVQNQWMLPYLAAMTPQYIEGLLRGMLWGAHAQGMELFTLMIDTDPEIAACVEEYTEGVMNKTFLFEPYHEEDQEASKSALEKCKLASAALRGMRPDASRDENDLRATVKDIAFSRFHGISVLNTDWNDTWGDGQRFIRDIPGLGQVCCPRATSWVHPVCYALDRSGRLGLNVRLADAPGLTKAAKKQRVGFDFSSSTVRLETVTPFPLDDFLIAVNKAKTGSVLGGSCLRPLAFWWIASNFCGDWLMNFAQLFGVPFRVAHYGAGVGPAAQAEIRDMLQKAGSAGYILLPEGATLETLAASNAAGTSPQAFLHQFADSQKRKVILHQTMTGGGHDSMGKGGGKAFGEVEQDTKGDCIETGAKYVAGVINLQLIPALLNKNYGDGGDLEAPTIRLIDQDRGGLVDAQIIQIASQLADVPASYVHKLFNIPKPKAGEEIAGQDVGSAGAALRQQKEMQEQQAQAQADALAQQQEQFAGGYTDEFGEPLDEEEMAQAEARGAQLQAEGAGHEFHGNQWSDVKAAVAEAKEHGHHVAVYNGKRVKMDYIPKPKEQFKFAAMRISDNGANGHVVTPKGEIFEVKKATRSAKPVKLPDDPAVQARRISVEAKAALAATVAPLKARLEAIAAVADKETRLALLAKFNADHAAIAEAIRHDDTLAKLMEQSQ